jgi:hypothetical protein
LRGVVWLAGDRTSGRSGQSAKIFQIPEVPLSVQSATATITRAVTAAAGVYAPGHLGELTQYLPFELVDDVLEQTRTVQRRLRDLPSRTGVYFLVALAMFPRLGYARVWAKLTAGLAGLDVPSPSEKALRDLRRRLGPAPLKALFEVVAGPLAWPHTPGVCFAGLRTVAFDGLNSLKVPDTDRNRSWIGRIRFRMGFAGYPTLRLMALAETGTRGLLGAVLGSAGDRDEAHLARRLLHLLRPGMRLLRARCGLRSRVSQWREGHEDLSHELQIRRLGPRIPSGSAFSGSAPPRPPGPDPQPYDDNHEHTQDRPRAGLSNALRNLGAKEIGNPDVHPYPADPGDERSQDKYVESHAKDSRHKGGHRHRCDEVVMAKGVVAFGEQFQASFLEPSRVV